MLPNDKRDTLQVEILYRILIFIRNVAILFYDNPWRFIYN